MIIRMQHCAGIAGGSQTFLGTSDIISDVKKLHVGHLEPTADILISK